MTRKDRTSLPGQPDLAWDESDGPVLRSRQFDDVYFSELGGLEETRHVFLGGNDLTARFAALAQAQENAVFTIGELGFGTGLNALAAWAAWNKRGHVRGHLHIVSVEGYPLPAADFAKAQGQITARWPELAEFSAALTAAYPPLLTGTHQINLTQDVTLTLLIGEAADALRTATAQIDAWFLDGFSPAKNPEMWRDEVLDDVVRLSRSGTTLATFTVAGAVRRALADRGFTIAKRPGFGRKRHMLTACMGETPVPVQSKEPWFLPPSCQVRGNAVVVLGAGIAGASAAWHLKRAGMDVTVCDPAGVAAGASGNWAGLVLPRLDLGATPAAEFYKASWLYALALIGELEKDGARITLSKGGRKLARDAATQARNLALAEGQVLPPELMALAENGDLTLSAGGTVSPPDYVAALLGDTPIVEHGCTGFETGDGDALLLRLSNGETLHADHVVIANAMGTTALVPGLPLTSSLGQIDLMDHAGPAQALTAGHYAAPFNGQTVIGATYENVPADTAPAPSAERQAENIAAARALIPDLPAQSVRSRAAIRCVTPDRHPMAGPLPDFAFYRQAYEGLRTGKRQDYPPAAYHAGVWLLTGLGSRGLVTAPLCAAYLTSLMTGAPAPLPADQAALLHPGRFMIRALKRNELPHD